MVLCARLDTSYMPVLIISRLVVFHSLGKVSRAGDIDTQRGFEASGLVMITETLFRGARGGYMDRTSALTGCLLGTAVGDALGLPYEGLSPLRARRLLEEPTRYRFLLGRGMISDDTEHACMTLAAYWEANADVELFRRSLASSGALTEAQRHGGGEVEVFRRSLARRLRWWLAAIPAGVGMATLRAVLRLWIGFSPQRSGVWSAGNVAAMRAGVLGVAMDDLETLREFVLAQAVMTHRDPQAFYGALAIGVAAHLAARREQIVAEEFLELFTKLVGAEGAEMIALVARSAESSARGESVEEFAKALGLARGVSGFVNHTVPVVIQAWLRYPGDFEKAVQGVIRCGGDADTTGALVGGIVGAAVGQEEIPRLWIDGLIEWPRSAPWMRKLAENSKPTELFWPAQLGRNVVFLAVVLIHGFRRLLPPY